MFGKLKEMAGDNAVQLLVDKAGPEIKLQLQRLVSKLDIDIIADDGSFADKVIPPLKMAVEASASGATKLIPGFDGKFDMAMFHLRDELIVANEYGLELVEDFDARLPEVLKDGMSKAAEMA